MTTLDALWLPILLSAVFVFLASSLLHMVIPIHKADYKGLPDEQDTLSALRDAKIPPGQYMFPHADSMKEAVSKEMVAKFNEGPVGVMIMRTNGMPNMGKSLCIWFLYCIVISVLVAYLTGIALAPGATGVFQIATITALLGYAFTSINDSIWKGVSWTTTGKFIFDGACYSLVTGLTFAWLWPTAI